MGYNILVLIEKYTTLKIGGKMKQLVLLACLVILLVSALSLIAVEKAKGPMKTAMTERSFAGFLSDQNCGMSGKDPMGNDLVMYPGKNTVANMKTNEKSGFGLYIKGQSGKYVFHKFDMKGSEMAKTQILDKTTMKNNIMVTVMGTLDKDGMINVKTIMTYKPKPMPIKQALPITGKK
jgi:hypothetical protein